MPTLPSVVFGRGRRTWSAKPKRSVFPFLRLTILCYSMPNCAIYCRLRSQHPNC